MNYYIEIDKEQKIVKYRATGSISSSDMGNGWKAVFDMPEFIALGYDILADYRTAEFNFSIADTQKLAPILNGSKSKIPGKKFAVIVNVPYSTAITIIIQEMFHKGLGHSTKIFSTEEAAVKWLLE